MTSLGLFFKAERIKWRMGWTLLTAFLAPICQIGFLFTMVWFSEEQVQHSKPGFRFWLELSYMAWNLLTMPIVVALISDLSWGLEDESHAWDHLLHQPVPHRTHYLVKLFSHLSLLFLAQLLFALLLVPAGLLLRTNPFLEMGTIPWVILARFASFTLLASLPLVALHTWLSTRFTGAGVSLATALAGTWLSTRLVGVSSLVSFIPWGMSSQMVLLLDRSKALPWALFPGSLLLTALLAGLGTLDFARRSESRF